jgi:protease I
MKSDKKALIVSADLFEDSELLYPMYRLQEEGWQVDIATPGGKEITGKKGYSVAATHDLKQMDDAGSCGYAALILPGGKAPAVLREMPEVMDIVRDYQSAGIPIAAICHGPQILISAKGVKGKKMTAYESVAEEVKAAGAEYLDEEVVVDGQIVTSRKPADLPAFMRELMKKLPK